MNLSRHCRRSRMWERKRPNQLERLDIAQLARKRKIYKHLRVKKERHEDANENVQLERRWDSGAKLKEWEDTCCLWPSYDPMCCKTNTVISAAYFVHYALPPALPTKGSFLTYTKQRMSSGLHHIGHRHGLLLCAACVIYRIYYIFLILT